MFVLHIEHAVTDYDAWKRIFDTDPLDRKASGVTSFRIMRPVGDSGSVMIDLEFGSREAAERMHTALEELWKGPAAAVAISPHVMITELVEAATL